MTFSLPSLFATATSRRGLFRTLSVLAAFCAFASALFAQDDANNNRRNRRSAQADNANTDNGGRQRGNFDPQQMQAQMLDRIKEAMGVTDDAEWKIISDRITAVMEARRNTGGGFGRGGFPGGGFRGGDTGGGNGDRASRRGGFGGGSPEQDALRQAIQDKLPDAEIKSRIERLREVRKANEEKLAKAQEDLRAVLSVRQEGMAVLYGFLP